MSNIIQELYYGNIEPHELNSELTDKLKRKLKKLTDKEEHPTAKLREEEKELFLNYASAYNEFSSISNSDNFISGFRLGAKFTYDTFVNNGRECVK